MFGCKYYYNGCTENPLSSPNLCCNSSLNSNPNGGENDFFCPDFSHCIIPIEWRLAGRRTISLSWVEWPKSGNKWWWWWAVWVVTLIFVLTRNSNSFVAAGLGVCCCCCLAAVGKGKTLYRNVVRIIIRIINSCMLCGGGDCCSTSLEIPNYYVHLLSSCFRRFLGQSLEESRRGRPSRWHHLELGIIMVKNAII